MNKLRQQIRELVSNLSPDDAYDLLSKVLQDVGNKLPKCPHCGQLKRICEPTGGVYGKPCWIEQWPRQNE